MSNQNEAASRELVKIIAEMLDDWGATRYSDDQFKGQPYDGVESDQMAQIIIEKVRDSTGADAQIERHLLADMPDNDPRSTEEIVREWEKRLNLRWPT